MIPQESSDDAVVVPGLMIISRRSQAASPKGGARANTAFVPGTRYPKWTISSFIGLLA